MPREAGGPVGGLTTGIEGLAVRKGGGGCRLGGGGVLEHIGDRYVHD